MENLTERQKNILEITIRAYIESGLAVSSKFIEENYDLGVSPATIRAELYTLIEKGYLFQPHTSSGRVPTDKGYRFFVDLLSDGEIKMLEDKIIREIRRMQKEVENRMRFMHEFTRLLAHTSSSLSLSYLPKENILLKEGWGEVFNDPEFDDANKVRSFMNVVGDFEKNIDYFSSDDSKNCLSVYIGNEAPFSEKNDFSILVSRCKILNRKGVIAIIGPKRMAYDKNIFLVESIIKLLNE